MTTTTLPAPAATFAQAKHGQGCTTTAAAFALVVARGIGADSRPVLLTGRDLDDLAAVLGMPCPMGDALGYLVTAEAVTRLDKIPGDAIRVDDAGAERRAVPTGPGDVFIVTRGCYLALRRLHARADLCAGTGLVMVTEPGRALTGRDAANVAGLPVMADVPYDVTVSRAVDAGLLSTRLPRPLHLALARMARALVTNLDAAGGAS